MLGAALNAGNANLLATVVSVHAIPASARRQGIQTLAFNDRTALVFQSGTGGGRRSRSRRRQAVGARRVGPALPGAVEIALACGSNAHTGIGNARRAGHRGRFQRRAADHNLRHRIDITPGTIGRIIATTELATSLANTVGDRIGKILAVRAAPAPLILGNQFRYIIVKSDAGIAFTFAADQRVLLEDLIAGAVKGIGYIGIGMIIPVPFSIHRALPNRSSRYKSGCRHKEPGHGHRTRHRQGSR